MPPPPRPVLLVEDEPLVAIVAEESLRGLGYDPIVVGGTASAIRAMEGGFAPVFALVDVGLPDGRGDDLAIELRRLRPDLLIVLVSGYDENELRSRFADDHAVQVMSKPYTEADLARAARSLGVDALKA